MLFHLHLRRHHRRAHKRTVDVYLVLFHVGLWWKTFYGILKIAASIGLFAFVGATFSDVFEKIFGVYMHSTSLSPDQTLAHGINIFAALPITNFLACYFLFWGIVEVFLSVCLLRRHLWAFPVSMIAISFFVLYQIVRYFSTHATLLLVSIVIDFLILYILHIEYKKEKVLYGLN